MIESKASQHQKHVAIQKQQLVDLACSWISGVVLYMYQAPAPSPGSTGGKLSLHISPSNYSGLMRGSCVQQRSILLMPCQQMQGTTSVH